MQKKIKLKKKLYKLLLFFFHPLIFYVFICAQYKTIKKLLENDLANKEKH